MDAALTELIGKCATRPPELPDGEIHLWRADLDRDMSALPALATALAPEELAKAGRFRFVRDRNRYIVAHGTLRAILAWYMNARSRDLTFRYGPQGKPELAGDALRFSMSHSHDLVLVAISRVAAVGVDVELVRPGVDQDVARCFMTRARQPLDELPRAPGRRAFFQAWTRMEAYLKARGEGLNFGLKPLEAFLEPCNAAACTALGDSGQHSRWWLRDFSPRRGYVGAVAVRSGECRLGYRNWAPHGTGTPRRLEPRRVERGIGISSAQS